MRFQKLADWIARRVVTATKAHRGFLAHVQEAALLAKAILIR